MSMGISRVCNENGFSFSLYLKPCRVIYSILCANSSKLAFGVWEVFFKSIFAEKQHIFINFIDIEKV